MWRKCFEEEFFVCLFGQTFQKVDLAARLMVLEGYKDWATPCPEIRK